MIVWRSNVYRLEPTSDQAAALASWSGACRFVYNAALEQRRDHYRKGKFSYAQQCRELTQARSDMPWLGAVHVHALQQALKDLDNAFQWFFSGIAGYPRPRRKRDGDRFRLPDPAYLRVRRVSNRIGELRVPKIGWVKFRNWRPLGGKLCNVTFKRKAGHWYAAVQWQRELSDPAPSDLPPVGIDRGIAIFAALSTGERIEPINAARRAQSKIARMQRRLARKKKFSANWRKLMAKIARAYACSANARKDYLHKASTIIAKSHGVVKVEALNVQGMSGSAKGTAESPGRSVAAKSGLNKSILDQGWAMFGQFLAYKLSERGGQLVQVPAANTSVTCSRCLALDRESRRDQATFKCGHCGHSENADVNAARNILQARAIAVEPPKRTLRRVGKRKQLREAA